jgi:glycolate oxidase
MSIEAAAVPSIEQLRRDLTTELGDLVLTDPATLRSAQGDRSGHVSAAPPLAVVEARTTADVQAALRFATAHRLPVVPRGAGTGLAGGAQAGAGDLVISTRSMTRILEISQDDELAVVEPGVLNADLNAALAAHGLFWAPDPASRAIATIGGNIATNAGGLHCVKYGVTREAVLGLEIVLADGRAIRTGHRTVKGVTGYDLTALMIGSEGTLGIVTEATLRLRPVPRGVPVTISAAFDTVEQAARAASVMVASGIRPAILELLDGTALDGLSTYLGLDLGDRGAQLLVQTDGDAAEREAVDAEAVIRSLGGRAERSADAAEGERLFEIRRAFHASNEARGAVLIEDVAVPRSALPAMFAEIERVQREYGLLIPTVAHAGDGNLHPNFVFEANAVDGFVEVPEHVWRAADDMFQACLRLGGTLTGEHGVGILKQRWIRDELGDDVLALQRGVKAAFDPLGLMNPGKAV